MQALANANADIAALETRLCLAHSMPKLNPNSALKRLTELESQIGAKGLAPTAAVTLAQAAAATDTNLDANVLSVSLAEYREMNTEARAQFCDLGGKLSATDFEAMKPKARMDFMKAGGSILEAAAPPVRRAPGNPDPGAQMGKANFAGNGAAKTEAQFEALSASEKMEFIRNNGRMV